MDLISAEDFKKKFQSSSEHLFLKDLILDEYVNINCSDLNFQRITIQNCQFNQKVKFNYLTLNDEIKIENSTFQETLSFIFLTIKDSTKKRLIKFKDSSFTGLDFGDKLKFTRSTIVLNELLIVNCKITSFYCASINFKLFHVYESEIHRKEFIYVHFEKFNVKKSKLLEDTLFMGAKSNDFIIEESNIEYFPFGLPYNIQKLILEKNIFPKSIELYSHSPIKYFLFSSNIIEESLIIGNDDVKKIKALTKINTLEVLLSANSKGYIGFHNLQTNKIIISGTNTSIKTAFSNLKLETFQLKNFNNFSILHFNKINSINNTSSLLEFDDVLLNEAYFYNFNFKSFNTINIKDSELSNSTFSNIEWFDDEQVNTNNQLTLKEDSLEYLVKKRNLYLQLKNATKLKGERDTFLRFKELEGVYHLKLLRKTKSLLQIDRIIQWTNTSNDFGQNWFKPIYLLLTFTFLFYYLMLLGIGDYYQLFPPINVNNFDKTCSILYENISVYWQLYNPAITPGKLFDKESISAFTHFVFMLHRLLYSYFVYQIVVAFRKFT